MSIITLGLSREKWDKFDREVAGNLLQYHVCSIIMIQCIKWDKFDREVAGIFLEHTGSMYIVTLGLGRPSAGRE